jgi:hypothetical protein
MTAEAALIRLPLRSVPPAAVVVAEDCPAAGVAAGALDPEPDALEFVDVVLGVWFDPPAVDAGDWLLLVAPAAAALLPPGGVARANAAATCEPPDEKLPKKLVPAAPAPLVLVRA